MLCYLLECFKVGSVCVYTYQLFLQIFVYNHKGTICSINSFVYAHLCVKFRYFFTFFTYCFACH